MRGWLLKEKSKATAFGGDTNKRWFEIERSSTTNELILSYYRNPPSTEAARREKSGWIFINDITGVEQDAVCRWITIRHPARTFRLQALDRPGHHKWFQELSTVCSSGGGNEKTSSSSSSVAGPEEDEVLAVLTPQETTSSSRNLPSSSSEREELEMSRAETEINFLRQITGSAAPLSKSRRLKETKTATATPASPAASPAPVVADEPIKMDEKQGVPVDEHKSISVDNPEQVIGDENPITRSGINSLREEWKTTQPRMTPRIDRTCRTTKDSPFGVNGEPVNKRIGRAIESSKAHMPDQNDRTQRRHRDRMIPHNTSPFSSFSSSSDESAGNEKSVPTNRSFADVEELTSPGGLEKYLIETHRASLLPDPDADSPPKQKIAFSYTSPPKTKKESHEEKSPNKVKGQHSGYIHPGLTPDKNFVTDDWDDDSSNSCCSSEDSYGGVW